MDKNKSRTDLLAAGRKKLQQYRQKKDNKGSNSKSSGKASKSGRDTQQLVADGEKFKLDVENTVAISESNDKVDSVGTDSAASSDKYLAKTGVSDIASHASASGFPSGGPGVDQIKSNQSGNDVDSGLSMDDGSSSFVSGDAKDSIERSDPIIPIEKSLDLSTSSPSDLSSDQKGGGEQVTDVGAMQDVGGTGENQIAKGVVKQFEGDGSLPSSGFSGTAGDNSTADPENASNKEDVNVAAQSINTDNTEQSVGCKKVDLSSVLDGSVIKLSQLAEILQALDEDEFRFLFLSNESSPEKFRDADEMKIHVSFVREAFERLKEQLHVPNFSKDAMHLQLCEQKKLVDKICAANAPQIEVHGKNEKISEEITKCSNEIKDVVLEREELQKQLHISKADVEDLAAEVNKLQNKLEMAQGEISTLSSELLDSKKLLQSLQIENESLNESLKLKVMVEEREKLSEGRKRPEEENEMTISEYEKQSHGLEELKSSGAGSQAECSKDLVNLQKAIIRIDELTKENNALNSDLEFYKGKLNELNESKSQTATVDGDAYSLMKHKADWSSLERLKGIVYDDASGFFALKRNLGSAEMVMRKLENEIESLHMHKVASKISSPKVSRLIQAFEPKHHVDEHDVEKPSSAENQTTEDLYMRAKMVTGNLRLLLEELVNDAENASEFCRVMQIKLFADAANLGRAKYASLRKHTDWVEEENIELMVLYEVMRSYNCDAVAKENELLNLCDALQKQELILKSENIQLREELKEVDTKITELHGQLDGIREESDGKVASISNKLQSLQVEVVDKESILEEWKSAFTQVLHTVGELDSTIEIGVNLPATGDNIADIMGHVSASVRGACRMIEDLRGQVEAAHSDHQEILERSDMALNTLRNISELVITFGRKADRVQDVLHSDVFSTLLSQIKELLDERLQLEIENQQLNADLITRSREIDELDKRCLNSEAIVKLVEEIEHSDILGVTTANIEPVARLESLILLLVQKYKEANQSLSSSNYLEMQLSDSQGQVKQLQMVLVQYENEILVLKQGLKTAEEDVIALNTKLKEKVAELEQSEQRVLSLREKLSIAVSKGKGLISQRDSLKQSLAETSKELEKCSLELLSKDGKLHELETKLRVYSEAGERMEALESELSYIRNSATALRESFLLKDSVLQRIEEILEDIELPEHFHSQNTIEKVEWLAKSGGNSLPPGDWEQRSSVGGGAYSDAGFVGVDGLKDDMQPNHDAGDDFKRRYEELENKFYGLAEQNEMLEQSLMDMSNLVQRWEGILNRLDMPSQLRSMEPEDKIQWFETSLSETQNHCYSLQQKINYLENFSGSLVAGVEDSQKRASEIVEAFQLASVEKEIMSLDLEIQSHENEEISKMNDNLEIMNRNLQHEVSILHEEKHCVEEDTHHTNDAIRRLQELLSDALQDSSTDGTALGQDGVRYVEEMLRKLIEKYSMLSSGKPVTNDPINVHATEKAQMSHTSREFDEQDAVTLRKKLEDSKAESMILKDERDGYMLKNQSLLHEVEELELRKNELRELLNQEELKSASLTETLSKKLEDSVSGLKILQEEKDRYEMLNQSLLSETEALGMKKKELQELLKQEELRSASLRDNLNKKLEDYAEELTLLKEEKNRYVISNQSLLHEAQELEMKNKELQELLHQEELRSASLKELLHQAELKSASLQELLNQDELKHASLRETLSRKLEDCMGELRVLKEEKDTYVINHQTLLHDVKELRMEKNRLQELLGQEELNKANLQESLSKKVQDSISELMILKEEKETLVLSNQSLLKDVKELEMSRRELQELLEQEGLKSESLAKTLKNVQDSMSELMILQDEKDILVQNNQSMLRAVEELEMKRRELQELLDQEEMKSASLAETLKNMQDSMSELMVLKDEKDRVVQNNQSLHHAVEELEMEKKELQELLDQEKVKSGSLAETLKNLQDSTSELVILKDEKDRVVQDNQSLIHAVEELKMKKKELHELLDVKEMKLVSFAERLKNLEDSASELVILRDEKDRALQDNQSLLCAVEELEIKKKELHELLEQEEMKSASLAQNLTNLQDCTSELLILKEEKDRVLRNNQSLLHAVEELELKKKELQGLLNQEEQKSNSLREKLNVAVRKGKSLVQQRDGMKQVIEELNAELERLKSETNNAARAVSEYNEQANNLLITQERLQVVESEKAVLRNHLEEIERILQEKDDRWNRMVNALENIDLGYECDSQNPDEKMKEVGRYLADLHTRMDSLDQESRKSKRAAELLLAELNEVQERNDSLQDELAKADHELSELSRERDLAEKTNREAFAEIEKLSHTHSEEKDRQLSEIMVLRSGVDSMREDLSAIERELGDVLSNDYEFLRNLKAVLNSLLESGGIPKFDALFPSRLSHGVKSRKSENKVFMTEMDSLWELFSNHSRLLQEVASQLSEVMMNVHRGYTFHKETCALMKKDFQKLELIEKEKESEIQSLRGSISSLYDTCISAISEIENWKDQFAANALASGPSERRKTQIPIEVWNSSTNDIPMLNEVGIKSIRDQLLFIVRDLIRMENDLMEAGQSEMKSTILNLQRELQEKDVQRDRVCTELVNQIKEAETNAKNCLLELQQVRMQLHDSQGQLNVMEEEHKILEQRLKELQDQETDSKNLQQKINSLTDALAAKAQETEALMQALDAQEAEMEELTNKIPNLESELQQKNKDLENLETSRAKALKKLSVTVSKFDELHYFCESLLSEVEKLQSQLQERDAEISFLRQEVTRCTNDALTANEQRKRGSDEFYDVLSWVDSLISRTQTYDITSDDSRSQSVNEYKEALQKKIQDLISELEDLRLGAQQSDILLQKEKVKVEDLTQKEQYLKISLHEKESQLVKLQESGDFSRSMMSPSEIVEVEPVTNKWASSGTVAPQVRSLRKSNNDQVAIAIDVDHSNDQLEDDDDKAHGFKSLTTSKFVPRFTRPVSDLVDGLWMSCDRALMRQPALRLGVILYWAVMHALLAAFVV